MTMQGFGATGTESGRMVPTNARCRGTSPCPHPIGTSRSQGTSHHSRPYTRHLLDAFLLLARAAGCWMCLGVAWHHGQHPRLLQLLRWQEPFGLLSAPSQCCFPSAVLFQHLISYCGLCGQLHRGSSCLIELLDSRAAKTMTRGKTRHLLDGQHQARASMRNRRCSHCPPFTPMQTSGLPLQLRLEIGRFAAFSCFPERIQPLLPLIPCDLPVCC